MASRSTGDFGQFAILEWRGYWIRQLPDRGVGSLADGGPPGDFASRDEDQTLVNQLVEAEVILDSGMAYWDPGRRSDSQPLKSVSPM